MTIYLDTSTVLGALLFEERHEAGLVFGTHDRGQATAARASASM